MLSQLSNICNLPRKFIRIIDTYNKHAWLLYIRYGYIFIKGNYRAPRDRDTYLQKGANVVVMRREKPVARGTWITQGVRSQCSNK